MLLRHGGVDLEIGDGCAGGDGVGGCEKGRAGGE